MMMISFSILSHALDDLFSLYHVSSVNNRIIVEFIVNLKKLFLPYVHLCLQMSPTLLH